MEGRGRLSMHVAFSLLGAPIEVASTHGDTAWRYAPEELARGTGLDAAVGNGGGIVTEAGLVLVGVRVPVVVSRVAEAGQRQSQSRGQIDSVDRA